MRAEVAWDGDGRVLPHECHAGTLRSRWGFNDQRGAYPVHRYVRRILRSKPALQLLAPRDVQRLVHEVRHVVVRREGCQFSGDLKLALSRG